jgi:FHS family L-fucose permease-like MFS transporter
LNSPAPLTEKRYVAPFILVTSLFFLWAIGVNLNDILIPHMKKAFGLSDFRSSLIQSAFFGGYFIAALPAGWLIQRTGYKKGILFGLLVCATGAFLFIPAAFVRVYAFFLLALFIMACGQGCLEVAANPYVTLLGPAESSERRLNLAQSFNAVGAVITPILGTAFILSGIEHRKSDLAVMSSEQLMAYRISEANMVKIPYLVITGIFLAVAVLIYFSNLPEVRPAKDAESHNAPTSLKEICSCTHLVQGVLAQFFYVGAQVGVASFVIRFAQFSIPGIREKAAAQFLQMHMLGFMIGRFAGSAIMKRIPAPNLLGLFSSSSMLCLIVAVSTTGRVPVWAVVLIGFFSFHHVSYNLCSKSEKPGALHEIGVFLAGDVDHRRSHFSGHHGLDLRRNHHPIRIRSALCLSWFRTLFRFARLPAGDQRADGRSSCAIG